MDHNSYHTILRFSTYRTLQRLSQQHVRKYRPRTLSMKYSIYARHHKESKPVRKTINSQPQPREETGPERQQIRQVSKSLHEFWKTLPSIKYEFTRSCDAFLNHKYINKLSNQLWTTKEAWQRLYFTLWQNWKNKSLKLKSTWRFSCR